jgi:hypothetical protein
LRSGPSSPARFSLPGPQSSTPPRARAPLDQAAAAQTLKADRHPRIQFTFLDSSSGHRQPEDAPAQEAKRCQQIDESLSQPVTSRTQAIEKLQWYALRWKIETSTRFPRYFTAQPKISPHSLQSDQRYH